MKLASGFCIPEPLFLSPQKSEGISTFSERLLQVFPICCYSLAVMAGKRTFRRRALRRPHPARREVTCGDTDMDWPRFGAVLHMTGLWGRSYLGVGTRCCQQNLTESSVKEKTWVYHEGNLIVEEYTYGITRRGIRPYGHLAHYRGWLESRAS